MSKQIESAAQITVEFGGEEIVVSDLDATTEWTITRHYGSGRAISDRYSLDRIEYGGSMTLKGEQIALNQKIFDSNDEPVPGTLTIYHMNGGVTTYKTVIMTSRGFQFSEGEAAETQYEFIAFGFDERPASA